MNDDLPVWIVLHRDTSDAITVAGQRRTNIVLVLDQATGLVVSVNVGTSPAGVAARALKDAVIRPAGGLPKIAPSRIVCSPEAIAVVGAAASKLTALANTSIVEGVGMLEAEDLFDSLLGKLQGRSQPAQMPTVEDWLDLYRELDAFCVAAPWQRWEDHHVFPLRLSLDGAEVERYAIVLGAANIQHGLNITIDPDGLRAAALSGASEPFNLLEDALVVHLDTWRETSDVFAGKARRYGWNKRAAFVPQLLVIRGGQPSDLSRSDARLLALATRAVVTQDARRVMAVGSPPLHGDLSYSDGTTGRFEVARP